MASWPDFRPSRLLERLRDHGVDFVVVGGLAAVAHGSAWLTNDLDIAYATERANLELLGAALVALGARLRGVPAEVPLVPDAATLARTRVLTLDTDEGPLDLLLEPAGAPAYERLRRDAERVEVSGVEVLIASLGDLMAMKRAAGQAKDMLDLEELEAIQRLRAP